MTGLVDKVSPLSQDKFEEQIAQLEDTIAEKSRHLDFIKAEKSRTVESTAECTKELGRRVALALASGPAWDGLLEFGQLLRRRRQADLEHMQTPADGSPPESVEDCVIEKAASLRAQVLQVQRALDEMRARRTHAAETPPEVPAAKPKRKKLQRN